MSTSTFRETVALVAAKAKEKLPQAVNGRVESAVKLVLAHDVTVLEDGSIEVGSSTDPLKVYHLVGATCTCKDFTDGKAPESWCKHRIAAGIAKRVREMLPQVPQPVELVAPETAPAPAPAGRGRTETTPLPEAAFSLTLKGTLDGVEALLTARGQTAAEFTANLQAIRGLLDATTATRTPQGQDATPRCPEHGAMKPSTKGTGYYCAHKLDDDTWCKSKGK